MNLYGDLIKTKLESKGFEEISELSKYVKGFLINRQNIIYHIDEKYYTIPGIDLNLGRIKLLETSYDGNYLYDELGKTIKRQINIDDFEENATIHKRLEIKYT